MNKQRNKERKKERKEERPDFFLLLLLEEN